MVWLCIRVALLSSGRRQTAIAVCCYSYFYQSIKDLSTSSPSVMDWAYCTCQGQELGLATSPPTTLSSALSSSRNLGWGSSSASTEHSRSTGNTTVRHHVFKCVRRRVCAECQKRRRSWQLLPRAAREVNTRNLSMSAVSWNFLHHTLLTTSLLYPQGPAAICVHLCLSHSYQYAGFIPGTADSATNMFLSVSPKTSPLAVNMGSNSCRFTVRLSPHRQVTSNQTSSVDIIQYFKS